MESVTDSVDKLVRAQGTPVSTALELLTKFHRADLNTIKHLMIGVNNGVSGGSTHMSSAVSEKVFTCSRLKQILLLLGISCSLHMLNTRRALQD